MNALKVTLAIVGSLLISSLGYAEIHVVPCRMVVDSKGMMTAKVDELHAQSATVTLAENEEIVFAEFAFEEELPPRTEVEVWPALEGETPPWEVTGENLPFIRNSWITDERTGSLVRFDVTDIVRAWEANLLPDLGFLVRVLNDEDAESQSPGSLAQAIVPSVRGASLIYYIEAVRPPRVDEATQPETPPSGKTPQREDQGGDPH